MKFFLSVILLTTCISSDCQVNDFIDTDYGVNGLVQVQIDTSDWLCMSLMELDEQNNQFIIFDLDSTIEVRKLFANGNIDYDFGENGVVSMEFSNRTIVYDLFLTKNRMYFIASDNNDIFLYSYDLNGEPDFDFGINGKTQINNSITPTYVIGEKDSQLCVIILDPFMSNTNLSIPLVTYNSVGVETKREMLNVPSDSTGRVSIRDVNIKESSVIVRLSIYDEDTFTTTYAFRKYFHDGIMDSEFGDGGEFRFLQDSLVRTAFTINPDNITFALISRHIKTYGVIDINGKLVFKNTVENNITDTHPNLLFISNQSITTVNDRHYIVEWHVDQDWRCEIFLSRYNSDFALDANYGYEGRYQLPKVTRKINTDLKNRIYFAMETDSVVTYFRTKSILDLSSNDQQSINEDEIFVYPNPTSGLLYIGGVEDIKEDLEFKIYDLAGRLIYDGNMGLETQTMV